MWMSSEQDPLCTSLTEESGPLANDAPLTQPLGFFVLQFRRRFQFVSLRHPFSKTRVPCVGVCVRVDEKRTSTTRQPHEEVSKINEMPLFIRTHEYKPPRHALALAAYTLERDRSRHGGGGSAGSPIEPFHRRRRRTLPPTLRFLLSGVTQVTFRKVSMLFCFLFRSSFMDIFHPKHCADLLPVTPSFLTGIRRSDGLFYRDSPSPGGTIRTTRSMSSHRLFGQLQEKLVSRRSSADISDTVSRSDLGHMHEIHGAKNILDFTQVWDILISTVEHQRLRRCKIRARPVVGISSSLQLAAPLGPHVSNML